MICRKPPTHEGQWGQGSRHRARCRERRRQRYGTWASGSHSIAQLGLPSGTRQRHRETSVAAGAQRHRGKSIL